MNEERIAKLRGKIAKLDSISTAPAILQPLLAIMRQPVDEIALEKVVELVSRDGGIAAQCLRVANSPLFARRAVETVRAAVMTLGIERVRSVLFGLCMNGTIPADKWVLDRNAFWRHSLGCALVTQTMASKIGYPEPEKAYLAGLLHDIGFLVISILDHEKFLECLRSAADRRCPLDLMENEVLGYTHEDAGSVLCEHWGFSNELVEAATCHHRLEMMATPGPLVCMVHLGDLLCRVRGLSYGYTEVMAVSFSQEGAWRQLVKAYPALEDVDFFRFTLDMDSAMDQIAALVDSVFGPGRAAGAASA
ncbi:MAG TPA: HDOD domain-containing protein [Terriglobales bacterium]|nr:HDOD domain-containing protein [Terriglobales bacterium]